MTLNQSKNQKSQEVSKELNEKKLADSPKVSSSGEKLTLSGEHIGKLLVIILTFIIGGNFLQSVIVFVLAYAVTHNLGVAEAAPAFFPLFLSTFPLTATTAVTIIVVKYNVVKTFLQLFFTVAVTFILTIAISGAIGIGGVNLGDLGQLPIPSNPVAYFVEVIILCYSTYGALKFFLSLLTGGLIAWVLSTYVFTNGDGNE